MPLAELVIAVAGHEQRACAVDASPEERDQVEGRLIRPVHVFEHQQRPLTRELIKSGGKQCAGSCARIDCREQRALRLQGDVVERRPRTGREQRVACSPEDTHLVLPPGEFPQQRRLANSGFSGQKRYTAGALDSRTEPFLQIGEARFAFEQIHRISKEALSLRVIPLRLACRCAAAQ